VNKLKKIAIVIAIVVAICSGTNRAVGCPQLAICSDSWHLTIQPAAAVGWQINLKTFDLLRVTNLIGVSLVWDARIPLGIGAYCGLGASLGDSPSAPQCDLLFSVANFGAISFGFQRLASSDYQALLGIAFNLNVASTTTALLARPYD
jgi:hypothetical protein